MDAIGATSLHYQSPRQTAAAASRPQETGPGEPEEKKTRVAVTPEDSAGPPSEQDLTDQERKQLTELKARDREVRAHEAAHQAAAGGYAQGGPSFTYQRGPDGKQYAIGGEVQIDTSAVPDDPQATLRKAQIIRQAALAPAEPSPQDRSIAAEASAMAVQARADLAKEGGDGQGDLERRLRDSGATGSQPPALDLIA